MRRFLGSEKALSTVVTTLIILVVSVLLAGVVTMYAINITSTRTQQEALRISKQRVWVYTSGDATAYAAFVIDNVGGRDVIIDKIQVRGVEVSWSSVYYVRRSSTFTTSLNAPSTSQNWDNSFTYTSGSSGTFTQASSDLALASGYTMVVYIKNPDSIALSDIGVTVGITVFTENAQYYVECNVETADTA